jgi:hypothetical protein
VNAIDEIQVLDIDIGVWIDRLASATMSLGRFAGEAFLKGEIYEVGIK